MEYYSDIRRSEFWYMLQLGWIMLSKINKTENLFYLHEIIKIGKFIETKNNLEVTRGKGWRKYGILLNGDRVSVWDVGKVLK